MIRMGGTDAMMLSNETPRAYMHTFKIAILDPSTDPEGWSFEKYYEDFASRMYLVPMFRWKLAPPRVTTRPCASSCHRYTPISWIAVVPCG